jgi:CDP-diacylglycerol--serine O-phosphatidyltransferase
VVASSVLLVHVIGVQDATYLSFVALFMIFLLAFLMVSTVPYYSFKKIGFIKMRRFNIIVLMVIIVFLVGLNPAIGVFTMMAIYLVSCFVMIPFRKRIIDAFERTETESTDELDID